MEYHGKLFGKIGNKYFDTGKTSEDFDNMSKRLAEFVEKLIKVRESFYNSFPVPLKMEYCDAINNHLKALDEIIEPIKGFHPLVGMRPDPTSLFDEINAKASEEERELAIKFMDETILQKDNSKGFTFGYRVHESETCVPSGLYEPDDLRIPTNGIYPPMELLTSFFSEEHQENAKRTDEMFFIPDDLNKEE